MVITMLFAWVPYVAVAWGYKVLTDGDAKTSWYALGALYAVRLFFGSLTNPPFVRRVRA